MFGKNPDVSPLASRKQLLIAESDLNRAQLVDDVATLKASLHSLTERAKSYGSIASAAAVLVAALAAFKRDKASESTAKPSWMQTVLKAGGTISALWLAFRTKTQ